MFRVILSCKGVPDGAGTMAATDISEEFVVRPWHKNVRCLWDGEKIMLHAENNFDATGEALLDEFSDAVFACISIEDSTISFHIESVAEIAEYSP